MAQRFSSNVLQFSIAILLISSIIDLPCLALQWPYNLPPNVKYYPEDEPLIKRDLDVQGRLQFQNVNGVRKMSGDPGEKFYLRYWSFEQGSEQDIASWTNSSTCAVLDSPVRVHVDNTESGGLLPRFWGLSARTLLQKRDFQCPAGTTACTSIGRSNSCCGSGTFCQLVQDAGNGLGDVGCCPNGETCSGSASQCPAGYSSCPTFPGGGCCLPGYICFDVGCIKATTTTVSGGSTQTGVARTTTVTSTTIITPSTSNAPPSTLTATVILTSFVTLSQSSSATTTTITTRTTSTLPLTCSSGFQSCPSSLGGGCCPTDRLCGSADCPASTTSASQSSSGTVQAPVRPTSGSTSTESDTSVIGCPTGFYACSAYYQGGCCQIGRDCAQTSCPTSASTTLVNTNGITAVAPTGSGITAPGSALTGVCAQGWSTCAPSVGGGCCPSGYACGTSCTATASGGGGSQVGKIAPNDAVRVHATRSILFASLSCLICLIIFAVF